MPLGHRRLTVVAIAALAAWGLTGALQPAFKPLLAATTSAAAFDEAAPTALKSPRVDTVRCAAREPATAREIAIVDFKGGIDAGYDSDGVYKLLNQIAQESRIGAIALRIDSSGGDSYTSKKLYEAVTKAKKACGLPVASFIGNVGTSGGYWLAAAGDEIHADPLSTIGAVGVIAIFKNEREKLDKEGVRYSVVRTGDRKWPLMPYLPVEGEDVKKIKDSLDIVLAEFVAAVEGARRGKLNLARERLSTGEAWMGRDALALGLVDPPEEVDRVAARLVGATPAGYRFFDLAKAARLAPATPPATPPEPAIVSSHDRAG